MNTSPENISVVLSLDLFHTHVNGTSNKLQCRTLSCLLTFSLPGWCGVVATSKRTCFLYFNHIRTCTVQVLFTVSPSTLDMFNCRPSLMESPATLHIR
ncbi:uncharacterized protein YALI1_A13148g [Yarrowia lipolytica]|uniref:Uncharacterized protein n=1 Tax=Yarrowia lipolytica TaxID=4952 RepID=A0A1D8N4L3_YARLL|nr:hypothetical protein YALI1_A13148g [Yarrowia lipolytica]